MNTGLVVVSGEITTKTYVDIQEVARSTIERIGYTDANMGFDFKTCAVINAIDKQSPDIAQGVDAAYETRQQANDPAPTPTSSTIARRRRPGDDVRLRHQRDARARCLAADRLLAHRLAQRLAEARKSGELDYLRPDGKTQVSVRYVDGRPVAIEKLLISSQHAEGAGA